MWTKIKQETEKRMTNIWKSGHNRSKITKHSTYIIYTMENIVCAEESIVRHFTIRALWGGWRRWRNARNVSLRPLAEWHLDRVCCPVWWRMFERSLGCVYMRLNMLHGVWGCMRARSGWMAPHRTQEGGWNQSLGDPLLRNSRTPTTSVP